MAQLAFANAMTASATQARQPAPQADPIPTKDARFSALEWMAIAVAGRDGLASLRTPGKAAVALGSLFQVWRNPRLADQRLEALRRIAVLSRHHGYAVAPSEVRRFIDAGFTPDQYELVVNSVTAARNVGRKGSWRA